MKEGENGCACNLKRSSKSGIENLVVLSPLTCLPLVAADQASLLEQAEKVLPFYPDTLEWRVDKFDNVRDAAAVTKALEALRKAIGNIPILFTCRMIDEGGFQEVTPR